MIIKYEIEEDNILIKEYLKNKELSSTFLKKVKLYGEFRLNGAIVKNYHVLKKGDILELLLEETINQEIETSKIDFKILYEDKWLMVISKPRDIACQPTRKHFLDNIISGLKHYFLENDISSNIHIVNRLDFSTSGLMIVAKSGFIHSALQKSTMERKYVALVNGILNCKKGLIDLPIARRDEISIKREISKTGKKALTEYIVLKEDQSNSYLLLKLHTGRTHQIRLHLSHLGHSIIGDGLYGDIAGELKLHCCYMEFIHPISKEVVSVGELPSWYEGEIDYMLI